jgi:hypothetical protein
MRAMKSPTKVTGPSLPDAKAAQKSARLDDKASWNEMRFALQDVRFIIDLSPLSPA